MRLAYRAKRQALVAALAAAVPGATLTGIPAGVYALALLPAAVSEPAVLRAAAAAGVWVEGLASHRIRGDEDRPAGVTGPRGVLLGYANLSEPALARAVALLGEAIAQCGRRTPTSSR